MKTICKYEPTPVNPNVKIPVGAKILSGGEQHGKLCIWAEVDPTAPLELVGFEVFGTGHEIPDATHDREFVDTVLMHNGNLVLHIYKMV